MPEGAGGGGEGAVAGDGEEGVEVIPLEHVCVSAE